MHRGYIKVWRKIEDNGIIGNPDVCQLFLWLMIRASSKPRKQLIGNLFVELGAGQVIVGRKRLAADLGSSERKIRTCLATLENMGIIDQQATNKFTIITLVNWDRYQNERPASDQQTDQQATSRRPAGDHKQEVKHLNIKQEEREGGLNAHMHVATPVPEKDTPPPEREGPKKTDCPSKGNPEWPAFLSCWQVYPVKQGQEDAWREWMRLKQAGTLAQAWEIRDTILRLSGEDSRWLRGKVPKMAKWLSGKGWDDEPYIEPADSTALMVRDDPTGHAQLPAARTQHQKNKQDLEGLAAFVSAADKEFSNGFTPESSGGISPYGNALPASTGREAGVAANGGGMGRALP